MGRLVLMSSALLVAALSVAGRQPIFPVNYEGPGVEPPVLLPSNTALLPTEKCEQIEGVVKLTAVVDQHGVLHDAAVISSDNKALNDLAVQWATEQRFKPGTVKGDPAAVSVALMLGLHACAVHTKHRSALELSAHPFVFISVNSKQELAPQPAAEPAPGVTPMLVGGHISAPLPTLLKDPDYPYEMKSRKAHGICVLSVLVDPAGIPREVHVVKPLEPALDQSAVDAVKSWRFQPALQDGVKPVPVIVTVSVGYYSYDKEHFAGAVYLPLSPDVVIHLKRGDADRVITAPKLLNGDEVRARYMPRSRVPGKCDVAGVIGADGIPRNVRALNSLDSSLGLDLVYEVQQMRFKPAIKDGTPVPIGFVFAFKYSQRDMLRADDGSMPWWMNLLTEGVILAIM